MRGVGMEEDGRGWEESEWKERGVNGRGGNGRRWVEMEEEGIEREV